MVARRSAKAGVCANEVDRVELQSPQGAGRTDRLSDRRPVQRGYLEDLPASTRACLVGKTFGRCQQDLGSCVGETDQVSLSGCPEGGFASGAVVL